MNKVEIEKGHAMPRSARTSVIDRTSMEVGDSYFVEGGNATEYNKAKSWAQRAKKDWLFSARTVEGGIRVWRIA